MICTFCLIGMRVLPLVRVVTEMCTIIHVLYRTTLTTGGSVGGAGVAALTVWSNHMGWQCLVSFIRCIELRSEVDSLLIRNSAEVAYLYLSIYYLYNANNEEEFHSIMLDKMLH